MSEAQSQIQGSSQTTNATDQGSQQRVVSELSRQKDFSEGKRSPLYSEQRWHPSWGRFRGMKWEDFSKMETSDKIPLFTKDGKLYDCLFAQQFDRQSLDSLCQTADLLRAITKNDDGDRFVESLLFNKRAMIAFNQPSSRTFLSFQNACHMLGMKTSEIRDMSTSSLVKGESFEDCVRTFSSYVHLMIMRIKEQGFVEKTAWHLNSNTNRPIPVVNAGSGAEQHPTQGLLDVYTIVRCLEGGIDGKHIVMVGDLKRGRTVRSLSYLMRNYSRVSITYVAPEQFRMEQDILDFLQKHNISYSETDDFEAAIRDADAIYMTRIQDEHDKSGESKGVDISRFKFQPNHLDLIKPTCILMHPLPRRDEIHVDVDKDERAVYWRQERNGMWMRAALISHIFRVNDRIVKYADSEGIRLATRAE